ncbi:MAG TPA: cysteine--tRNA ligase [Hymenobacter sp.]|uniref:cysteine--tRNA ligase n=1 Tax=Hymenobacter sp. TaxID=1898978 RepID=UPI002D80D780|nr:cysteine--tRNA ligase [Hymenobacter sp.]HET9503431.1 cysteine--tRNA ligase [Hymenobacter sp.]
MSLTLYNTLTRQKAPFEPVNPPQVGLYLCGPTVYNDAHLGNARGPIVFDVLTRYLRYLGYQVRYVRNITDVGHLESDADTGEDKMAKAARAKQLEPMQVAQHYTNAYRQTMAALGCLPPDIEPQASGHITEQIALIQEIMGRGLAYEANGSVYFDVPKYNAEGGLYGRLSGRVVEELLAGTRTELAGQEEKRSPADFALWKKAAPQHIMRWPSPWGEGFPGWHLECSAMSRKYLGAEFDIHGGGLDLMFPHHECEIAQNEGSDTPSTGARFWLHNNMLTVNGQKMSKSLGNFITLPQMFSGDTSALSQAYSPMTLRFFFLQAHYRSPIDLSDDALQAARKGYRKLMNGLRLLDKLVVGGEEVSGEEVKTEEVKGPPSPAQQLRNLAAKPFAFLDDDLNTPRAVAAVFDLLKRLNTLATKPEELAQVGSAALAEAAAAYRTLVLDVLGLRDEPRANTEDLLGLTLGFYQEAKATKAYDKVDQIRAALKEQGIVIKDTKTGVEWAYSEE